ncbi:hypothetical protein CBL_07359 [Carabus blaptoides fortunei]
MVCSRRIRRSRRGLLCRLECVNRRCAYRGYQSCTDRQGGRDLYNMQYGIWLKRLDSVKKKRKLQQQASICCHYFPRKFSHDLLDHCERQISCPAGLFLPSGCRPDATDLHTSNGAGRYVVPWLAEEDQERIFVSL